MTPLEFHPRLEPKREALRVFLVTFAILAGVIGCFWYAGAFR